MKSKLLVLLLAACLVVMRLWDPAPVEIARLSLFDFYQRYFPREATSLPVTIVDIDEASLQQLGQWPWPRSMLAELIDRLMDYYPAVVGIDFVFPEADRISPSNLAQYWSDKGMVSESVKNSVQALPDNDDLFAQSLRDQPIVLGRMLQNLRKDVPLQSDLKTHHALQFEGLDARRLIPPAGFVVENFEPLELAATTTGILSLLPERDGIVRRIPIVHRVGEVVLPSLGVEMLRLTLQAENLTIVSDEAGIDHVEIGGMQIPTSGEGLSWVHFNGHSPNRYVSAVDVLEGDLDPDALAGHLILIGTSASGLLDIKSTPMGHQMPGVEVWAQWLETVLFHQPLVRPNYITVSEVLITAVVCLLMIWLVSKAGVWVSVMVLSTVLISLVGFSWWLFTAHTTLFDFSLAMVAGIVMFIVITLQNFWREEQQRKLIHNTFSLYLAPDLVQDLVENPDHLRLDGESRSLTSLFTDLEGFTTLSENLQPTQLVDLLNRYLDGMCHIAMAHNGTIDKIIGDALHVIFGAPTHSENHAQHAVDCALAMDEFSQKFNQEIQGEGGKFGLTRIGVHTGEAVVGNFGGHSRFVYTAYGDTINSAARLESANKALGTRICISAQTAKHCNNPVRPIGEVMVKGKSLPIEVYQPLANDAPEVSYIEAYQQVYRSVADGDVSAKDRIDIMANHYPEDTLVRLHKNRFASDPNPGVRIVVS